MKQKGIVATIIIIMLIGANLTITANTNENISGNRDTITLNPTDDTWIAQGSPTKNYGSGLRISVRNRYGASPTYERNTLLRFSLDTIPSSANIESAYLYLYYLEFSDNNPSGRPLRLYRITSDWDENIVTWDTRPSYSTNLIDSTNVPGSPGIWMNWDVTSSVQDMISGTYTNYGWQIMDETYWGTFDIPCSKFCAKEYGSYIPYLEIYYTVDSMPTADANGPYSGDVGESITFDGSGSTDPGGSIIEYDWDFGDGNTGSGVNPTHTYTSYGDFTVSLTVTDNDYNTDTDITTAFINNPPIADAGGPYVGEIHDNIHFDGSGSADLDGTITSFEWDFGDGNTGTGMFPIHAYHEEGVFTVTLTVTDDHLSTDTDTTSIDIVDSSVTVNAGGPYTASVEEEIQFTGSASDGIPPYTFNWDFGDGQTSNEQNPTHSYTLPGDHQIILSVVDSENNHGWGLTEATITPAPLEVSANGPYSAKPGETISFTCTMYGGTPPYTFLWDFGDDTTGTEQNPNHIYADSKIYNVIVMVTDGEGLQESDTTTASISSSVPDLTCAGMINLGLVRPGDMLTTGFSIMNDGDLGSFLDWGIKSYPDWGSDWSYAVEEGQETDLTPEAGMIWVEISLTVPDTQGRVLDCFRNADDAEYTGEIVVENLEDISDTCEIPISMTVPKYRFCNPLQLLLQWIGNSFPFLRLNS